jgi:hypothetical protein
MFVLREPRAQALHRPSASRVFCDKSGLIRAHCSVGNQKKFVIQHALSLEAYESRADAAGNPVYGPDPSSEAIEHSVAASCQRETFWQLSAQLF